nr:gustatory receptor 25.3 [Papilio dardanus]
MEEISARIVNCMKPLLCMEYCYGLFRCRLGGRVSDAINLRMKILGIAITATWLIVTICAVAFSSHSFSEVFQSNENAGFLLIGASYVGSAILLLWQTKKNQKVLEKLAGVDIVLFASIDRLYISSFRHCKILFITLALLCIACVSMIFDIPIVAERIAHLAFTFIYFERKIEILVFCQLLYMLEQRLLLIKNYINEITYDRNRDIFIVNTRSRLDFSFIGHISNNNYKIRDLARGYTKIGKLTKLINEIYNYLIMTTLVTAFILIIIVVWSVLYDYKYTENYSLALPTLSFVFIELLSITLISCYCENLTTAGKGLNKILQRLTTQENLPQAMRRQAKVFLKITDICKLSINVYDFFDVNKQLVLKFISICTTYVIVVIQINHLI